MHSENGCISGLSFFFTYSTISLYMLGRCSFLCLKTRHNVLHIHIFIMLELYIQDNVKTVVLVKA
jgi:hypothetical protein